MTNNNGFNTARPSKCMFNRCDWPYDGFHICVDLATPEPKLPPKPQTMSAEQKAKIGEAVKRTRQTANLKRDQKIVELYLRGDIGLKDIAKEVDCAYQTVRNVLKRNHIVLRKQGQTIYRPGVRGAFN